MDKSIFAILACPICKGKLHFLSSTQEFICVNDKLLFVTRDGIPVMMEQEALRLTQEEMDEKLKSK